MKLPLSTTMHDSEGLIHLGISKGGIPLVFNRTVAQADIRISTGSLKPIFWQGIAVV
jgi:nickel-dependent lactate racemase